MSFRVIRSESFAPALRGLSIVLVMAAILFVATLTGRAIAPAKPSANWRWGMEGGIRHVEYDWYRRQRPELSR